MDAVHTRRIPSTTRIPVYYSLYRTYTIVDTYTLQYYSPTVSWVISTVEQYTDYGKLASAVCEHSIQYTFTVRLFEFPN